MNELILTSDAHPSGNFNPEIVKKLRNIFLDKAEKNSNENENRVWAYREHISRAVEILSKLKKYFINTISNLKTEQLNLVEKINLFKNTEVLAGHIVLV